MVEIKTQPNQLTTAVNALIKHEKKSQALKTELLSESKAIFLQVVTKKIATGAKPHPKLVKLEHSIYDQDSSAISGTGTVGHCCVIVKDPQNEYKQVLLELSNAEGQKVVSKVISIAKLKKKYSTFESRRLLADSYTTFLADERVVSLLPSLLGVKFMKKKKLPIPFKVEVVMKLIKVDKKADAYDMVYRHSHLIAPYYVPSSKESTGTLSSLKIGHVDMSVENVVANVEASIPQLIKYTSGGADNILALYLKTNDSLALPLYKSDVDTKEQDGDLLIKIQAEDAKRKMSALDRNEDEHLDSDNKAEPTSPLEKKTVVEVKKENRADLKRLLKKIKVQV